jgi:small GTP-binding protein
MSRNLIKKVCLLGDGEVGKTSLIRKFVYDQFDDKYLMTIGTKITKKALALSHQGTPVNLTLMINDIVGQVEFERIHKQYYRGSMAGILVCDLTRKPTLERIDWWLDSFREVAGDVPIILLGNKADLTEKLEISDNDLSNYSKDIGCSHFITSAKTGLNVEKAFIKVGKVLCQTNQ